MSIRSLAVFSGAVAAVLLGLASHAEAACDLFQTVPDGRFRGPYIISSGTNDVAMRFLGVLGKSYSVEALVESAPFNAVPGGSFSLTWGTPGSVCPVVNVTGLRRTETIDPATEPSPTNYFRGSFTASSTNFYVLRIGNTSATAVTISVSVSETTLFSPAWSTNGSYDTFYSLQNTTRSTCNGTLTLYDTSGTAVSTAPLSIPSAATASTNTSTLGTTRNAAGTAKFTHDCPPGAFLGEAAIANFSISPTPYFQFVHFEGTREAKTH
jgi:hypothetical protein